MALWKISPPVKRPTAAPAPTPVGRTRTVRRSVSIATTSCTLMPIIALLIFGGLSTTLSWPVLGALQVIRQRTKLGRALRATTQNPVAARLLELASARLTASEVLDLIDAPPVLGIADAPPALVDGHVAVGRGLAGGHGR